MVKANISLGGKLLLIILTIIIYTLVVVGGIVGFAFYACHAEKIVVVEEDKFSVAREPHVRFDGVALLHRAGKCGVGVFGYFLFGVVQAAVGDRRGEEKIVFRNAHKSSPLKNSTKILYHRRGEMAI